MKPPLLHTKITAPPGQHILPRKRLLNALQREVPRARLTLVAAPVGYGKTSLLAQWAREPGETAVAWLTLDEGDDDVRRFFRYLLAAWEQAQPGIMDSALGLLLSDMTPDSEAVLAQFINEGQAREEHVAFVLDDYHVISEPAIHEALTFLLEHLPPSLHFVLACRAEPPLPVARFRARRQLFELGPDELGFSTEETAVFLQENMGLRLSQDQVRRLQEQCEGWAAGLQLAGLGMRRRDAEGEPVVISGRQRFIADYLAQDVLGRQEAPVRSFLLRTSILQQLSGPLCDAVLRGQDSQQMLERLQRDNLFLESLDDDRKWFRYHRLFRQFLREEASRDLADELPELHRRAALWHLDGDYPRRAFSHAVASGDLDITIRVGERYFVSKLHAGEFRLIREWLDALPEEWYAAYPAFWLVRAGVFAFSGDVEASMHCVEQAERLLTPPQSEQARRQLGRATAVRCFMACFRDDLQQAESFANKALAELSEDDVTFRADTYVALGDLYRRHGRWADAEASYRKVLQFAAAPTYRELSIHAYGALADLELRQGRLRNAADYWHEALQAIEEPENWGRVALADSGWAHVRLAEILYEWNQLPEAERHLAQGLERAELAGDVRGQIAGYLLRARLQLTQGELPAAGDLLKKAHSLLEGTPFDPWQRRWERLQLELWLAEDRLRAALRWADETADGLSSEQEAGLRSGDFNRRLCLVRVLIVKGDPDSLQQAASQLRPLLRVAEEQGRLVVQIEALALSALAHWRRGDQAEALKRLEEALRLGRPEGYVRLLVDLGLPMARLLQEAQARDVLPETTSALLEAFGEAPEAGREPGAALPEPLTPREEDVLQLLAAGLTNREIGEQLVISPQTVKKHAGNIYGKLDVGNRTEAVARARELNLLA